MSTDRDVTRIVRSWLHEDAYEDADRLLGLSLDQVETTPQRRATWLARRFPIMNNNTFRLGIAAAAVVLVAFLGIKFLPWSAIGSPQATATPEPTPSPLLLEPADLGRLLNARTYGVSGTFALPFTITVPSGWSLSTLTEGDVGFTAHSGLQSEDAFVFVDLIENVFADPCHTVGGPMNPPVPSTVDGFVEALTHVVTFTAGPVSDVRIGGHGGKAFMLTIARFPGTAMCTDGSLHLWTIRGGAVGGVGTTAGATEQIWVIDVGGTIVVIDGASYPTTSDVLKGQIQGIVESIKFE